MQPLDAVADGLFGDLTPRPFRPNAFFHALHLDRKSTRLNSSHSQISYAVFCLKKKKTEHNSAPTKTLINNYRRSSSAHHPDVCPTLTDVIKSRRITLSRLPDIRA